MGMAAGEKIKNVNAGEKNEKLHQKRGKCLKIAPFWTINAKKFWGKKDIKVPTKCGFVILVKTRPYFIPRGGTYPDARTWFPATYGFARQKNKLA